MKFLIISLLLVLCVLVWGDTKTDSEPIEPLPRHAVYVTAGTLITASQVFLRYELSLIDFNSSFFNDLRMNIGLGIFNLFGNEGMLLVEPGILLIVGNGAHHLEVGVGLDLGISFERSINPHTSLPLPPFYPYPSANVGYRLQKPGKEETVFRVGLAAMEGLYVSLGFGF